MTEKDNAQILARLDALERRYEQNTQRLFERLDDLAEQGHEVRISALEKRIDGMWAKVVAVVGAVSAGTTLLWNLMKGGTR